MDYLKLLCEDSNLAADFDMLFDFCLLDGLEERDTAEGRCIIQNMNTICLINQRALCLLYLIRILKLSLSL